MQTSFERTREDNEYINVDLIKYSPFLLKKTGLRNNPQAINILLRQLWRLQSWWF